MTIKIRTATLAAIVVGLLFLTGFACSESPAEDTPDAGNGEEEIKDMPVPDLATARSWLVDRKATTETAALFYHLKNIARRNILFGQQDATKQGYGWVNQPDRCDVKEVTGSFPAVYGWDFIHIANFERGEWFDNEANVTRQLTIEAFKRGGINTYSWHYANPISKGSFYYDQSKVPAVYKIIPGGDSVAVYKKSLRTVATFIKSLQSNGVSIPIIFRPFHEMDGSWFWWGESHCTPAEYKSLYRFTVNYLRDSLDVHNVLYAWSPDRSYQTEDQYLTYYPGDAYVDLVGSDNYWDLRKEETDPSIAGKKFKIMSDYAKAHNKVAALTETGLLNLTRNDWFNQMLYKALRYDKSIELAYVLLWTNSTNGYWSPHPGQASEDDFKRFKSTSYVMFEDDLKNSVYILEK